MITIDRRSDIEFMRNLISIIQFYIQSYSINPTFTEINISKDISNLSDLDIDITRKRIESLAQTHGWTATQYNIIDKQLQYTLHKDYS